MDASTLREIEVLRQAPLSRLREKHRELFGEEPRSKHKDQLFRRMAWRLQALAEGGLSERALQRAGEIANEADLRSRPPAGMGEVYDPMRASVGRGRLRSRYDRRKRTIDVEREQRPVLHESCQLGKCAGRQGIPHLRSTPAMR